MKLILTPLFLFITIGFINAQEVDQISVGAGYTFQTFYNIETGEKTTVDGDSWDIAFSVIGLQDAGVLINEAAASMDVELELYDLASEDFQTTFSEADLEDRLFNDDKSWLNGAFNEGRDLSSFSDFGWGLYNPAMMSVNGEKVFALKLRNGQWKKLQIQSLVGTVYTFRYADFDGGNEKTVSFDKADFSGNQMAYFSFETEQMKSLEPLNWDLVYTRYSSPVPDGMGDTLNYVVTGIMTANGVQVAQADQIDPLNVMASDFVTDYSSDIDVIGFDWKDIDITTFQWTLVLDRVYFVRTEANKLFKLYFIDFEGSSTGVTTLEKVELMSTSTSELDETGPSISNVYPNPTNGAFSFEYETENANNIKLSIYQLDGSKIYNKKISVHAGTNSINIEDFNGAGNYFLVLDSGDRVYSQTLIIK